MRRAEQDRRQQGGSAAPLGEALKGYLRKSGLATAARYPRVQESWERIVGPDLAKHTQISACRRGTLEVSADSSALLNDLSFHREALLKDIQREVKRPFISRISFILMADRNEDEQSRSERNSE